MMDLVKAEFLWTRVCPHKCSYCAMADGRKNIPSLKQWEVGIENLKKLGCGFVAFYGAEPLMDFEKLPEAVGYAEGRGIHTTIITSGGAPKFFDKLAVLKKHGAVSLSMSYDIVGLDRSSRAKTNKALRGLNYFKELGSFRDVAAIATLSRKNMAFFSSAIRELTKESIWFFFDLIHLNRGQPGSKCRSFSGQEELIFCKKDIPDLRKNLIEILSLKDQGYLCHTSRQFIDLICSHNNLQYDWHCGHHECFPSWVSVDCDGEVGCCDDFRPLVSGDKKIFIWELFDRWEEFKSYWKDKVEECPGCLWNTHIDAHLIKQGELPFSDYIHSDDKVSNFNFGDSPCPRISQGRVLENERHPCFFCGYRISVLIEQCHRCGLMTCPKCGRCYCSLNMNEKLFLYSFKIRCCNQIPSSNGLVDLKGIFIPDFAKFTQQAYEFCRREELKFVKK